MVQRVCGRTRGSATRWAPTLGGVTDYVVGPGGTAPEAASSMDAHALLINDLPLLVLAARYRATQIGVQGELLTADALDATVLDNGGRRLVDLDFAAPIAPGWRVELTAAPDRLIVTAPGGSIAYDGTLGPNAAWLAPVRAAAAGGHGLPVVICSAGSPDDVLEAMASGRSAWVRAAFGVH